MIPLPNTSRRFYIPFTLSSFPRNISLPCFLGYGQTSTHYQLNYDTISVKYIRRVLNLKPPMYYPTHEPLETVMGFLPYNVVIMYSIVNFCDD